MPYPNSNPNPNPSPNPNPNQVQPFLSWNDSTEGGEGDDLRKDEGAFEEEEGREVAISGLVTQVIPQTETKATSPGEIRATSLGEIRATSLGEIKATTADGVPPELPLPSPSPQRPWLTSFVPSVMATSLGESKTISHGEIEAATQAEVQVSKSASK